MINRYVSSILQVQTYTLGYKFNAYMYVSTILHVYIYILHDMFDLLTCMFQPFYMYIAKVQVVNRASHLAEVKHSLLAFYVNLHRAVIGPSATLTGR